MMMVAVMAESLHPHSSYGETPDGVKYLLQNEIGGFYG
jgi:hypothetical protein